MGTDPGAHRLVARGEHDRDAAAARPERGAGGGKERRDALERDLQCGIVGGREARHPSVFEHLEQGAKPGLAGRHHRHHRHPEKLGEPSGVDRHAARARLVHHVEDEDHRHAELGELQRDEQRAAQVLRIRHLHHRRPAMGEEDVARDPLVVGDRDQGIDAGSVDDFEAGRAGPVLRRQIDEALELAHDRARRPPPRHLDRGARVIGHGHVAAGEMAEEDALPDVRIADEKQRLEATAAGFCSLGSAAGFAWLARLAGRRGGLRFPLGAGSG